MQVKNRMNRRVLMIAIVMILSVPYGTDLFLWMSLEKKKIQISEHQQKVSQAIAVLQERMDLSNLWQTNKKNFKCMSSLSIDQRMQLIMNSLKTYPGVLNELRQQDNGIDVSMTMPIQEFFDWMLSDRFQESCLFPKALQIKNASGLLSIKLYLSKVDHE